VAIEPSSRLTQMETLATLLTPERTACRIEDSNKKRLFETIATIVSDNRPELSYSDVLDNLVARENLGSTGLGQGIALPHCRVDKCEEPLGTLLSLASPIPFEAPDERPVDLLFVLLVPTEARQQHLDILADIARNFSDPAFCARLREAGDDEALYAAAIAGAG